MKIYNLSVSLAFLLPFCLLGNQSWAADKTGDEAASIEGSWDLTIHDGDKEHPSWLEVYHSGTKWLVGQFVGIGGSARPISVVHFEDGKMSFSIPPQWEAEDRYITFEGTWQDGRLSGSMTAADGKVYQWTGVRAPSLVRDKIPSWGKPIALFNGKNLAGWKAMGDNQWVAGNGVLSSPRSGSNLVTEQKFDDFKLHIEFKYPSGSNSGIYLRGRYEIQIIDSKDQQPARGLMGAVYGFIIPVSIPDKGPDEWQSYDITLIGRRVTVVLNGKEIICDRPIPGITGGALDSREGEPGPIYLQGDHGPIQFRNIVLTPGR